MKKNIVRKGLVLGIIILFIGIGFKPVLSNEVSIPTISYSEEDCIECKSNKRTYLTEKFFNKMEKYAILSKDINSIKPQDDSPLCDYIIDRWLYYRDLAVYYWEQALKYPMDSLMFLYYNFLNYVYDYLCMFYYNLGIGFDCEVDPY